MKTSKLFILLIIILITATGCPAQPELTKTITFELGSDADNSDSSSVIVSDINNVEKTLHIIQERLTSYGIANRLERNPGTNDYTLWLPEKTIDNAVKRLISTTGKVEIWEMFDPYNYGWPQKGDSIYDLIYIPSPTNLTFTATRKNRRNAEARIRRYAQEKQWPQNIQYVWSLKPAEENSAMYILYLLRSANPIQTPAITNEHIEKTSFEQNNGIWFVNVSLNTAGANRFEKVTRENVGRGLAIVIDNKVYSAPNVNHPIEGGRLQISGNFTKSEAEEFTSILRYEALPLTVKIKD